MNSQDLIRLKELVLNMKTSPVHDYVIPGLTSSLVGAGVKGTVRLFTQERDHEEPITPHSHRFDFSCLVLQGVVKNVEWSKTSSGDLYSRTKLLHHGGFGKYDLYPEVNVPHSRYSRIERTYVPGSFYHMKAEEIHSIFFSKDAVVLFFEGPNRLDHSFVLEPVSDGRVIPTFKVEPWMFRRPKMELKE